MKSLSDYAKILRDSATNLNLHGESVEMIVQMLANALYISEVEHITYSQEASLERASNVNSKIQHCVDQMYSVYRGANPRVYINFTAQKLFTFNPHDLIIKSNNFNVYYLGYINTDDPKNLTISYSPVSVTTGGNLTIIGILSSAVYDSTWTVSDNIYYESHPESGLSGDIYLKDVTATDGTEKILEVTRQFYDHLREGKMFDLTLPGYGCRIYYPEEYEGEARESLPSKKFSLTAYKYLSLSSIVESELKALKMTGATFTDFKEAVLGTFNLQEDWPGIVYVPETPRDGIETIHHKSNKSRFTGTYLATNSDLSYLLQEYFPEVIRTSGVTYRFEIPPSTTLDTIHHTYLPGVDGETLLSFTGVRDENIRTWKDRVFWKEGDPDPESCITQWSNNHNLLPAGTLSFRYSRAGVSSQDNTSYELILSSSIIPVTMKGSTITADIKTINFQVLENASGKVTLKSFGDLGLSVKVTGGGEFSGGVIKVSEIPMDITVALFKGTKEVDREIIPVVVTPVAITTTTTTEKTDSTTTTEIKEEGTGNLYAFDLSDDTLYIQTDLDGNLLSTSNTIEASMYHNGVKIKDGSCRYSIIPVSDISAAIDPASGVLEIQGMSEVLESSLVVMAEYNGNRQARVLTVKKSISNVGSESLPKDFNLYYMNKGEKISIATLTAAGEEQEFTLEIPDNTYPEVLFESGLKISDPRYDYSYTVLKNLIDPEIYSEIKEMVPSLVFYYIPYSNKILTEADKKFFKEKHKAYYVTEEIKIMEGTRYTARFEINLGLYSNAILDDSIGGILETYNYKFGLDFGVGNTDPDKPDRVVDQTETYKEIESLISKIPEVKYISEITVRYYDASGDRISYEEVKKDLDVTYFNLEYNIYSTVSIENS